MGPQFGYYERNANSVKTIQGTLEMNGIRLLIAMIQTISSVEAPT